MAHYAMRRPRSAKQLSRLMGFEVDGSADDFREVGRAIPFVRFTPCRNLLKQDVLSSCPYTPRTTG